MLMNPDFDEPTLSYFVSKPYLTLWACLIACAIYILGRMVYSSPDLVLIFGPGILILLAIAWPLLKDLVRFKPKLVVTSDRIFYEGWPFKKIDLKNVKMARLASLASEGASRIHLEVINEDELLEKYGFLSRLILRGHRVSGDTPIVINLTTLRKAKSQEVLKAINTRIAMTTSAK